MDDDEWQQTHRHHAYTHSLTHARDMCVLDLVYTQTAHTATPLIHRLRTVARHDSLIVFPPCSLARTSCCTHTRCSFAARVICCVVSSPPPAPLPCLSSAPTLHGASLRTHITHSRAYTHPHSPLVYCELVASAIHVQSTAPIVFVC